MDKYKMEWEGVYIDNDEIKDIAEDWEHLGHSIERFMDPKSEFM